MLTRNCACSLEDDEAVLKPQYLTCAWRVRLYRWFHCYLNLIDESVPNFLLINFILAGGGTVSCSFCLLRLTFRNAFYQLLGTALLVVAIEDFVAVGVIGSEVATSITNVKEVCTQTRNLEQQ